MKTLNQLASIDANYLNLLNAVIKCIDWMCDTRREISAELNECCETV